MQTPYGDVGADPLGHTLDANSEAATLAATKLIEIEECIAMVQHWHDSADLTSDEPELDRADFTKITSLLGDFRAMLASVAAAEPAAEIIEISLDGGGTALGTVLFDETLPPGALLYPHIDAAMQAARKAVPI